MRNVELRRLKDCSCWRCTPWILVEVWWLV